METLTFKQMCDVISNAKILVNKYGINPTPEKIFKYSPTGEIFKIIEWYEIAKNMNELTPREISLLSMEYDIQVEQELTK